MAQYQNISTGEIISVWDFIDRLPMFGEHGGEFESGFVRITTLKIAA